MIPKDGQFIAYYIDERTSESKVIGNISATGFIMSHYMWVDGKLYGYNSTFDNWNLTTSWNVADYIKKNASVAGFLPVDMTKARIQL